MEKYKNFGLLVLALLFALPAAAQLGEERHNFAVGINGGLNMSSVSFNPKIKLNTLNTMSMGVTMRYMSEKYFKMMCGVQMEINYSQRGWDEKIEDDSGNSYSRTMNYLEIPFMAHLAFGKDALNRGVKVFFNAGPQIGFFLGDNEKINWTTSTTRPEHGKEVENKFDYGITAGAGLEVSTGIGHFLLEGRYYMGLSDFYSDPETDELYILSGQDVQLYRYHKNGRFIDQREVPDRTQSFIKLGPQFWFYEGYNNGKYPERLTQTDSALQVMGKYLPMETRTLEASIGPLLTQHRNEAYLFTALEPVIYRIIPGSAVPFLKFDFGKYNVPESYWETENAMQAFTDLSQKGFISIAGFMMNDDYIVTELNQQTGMEDSECYYLLGIKERHNGKWNWIRQRAEENKLIADNQPAPKVSNRPEWYAKKLKGFTQDGKLMIFLSGYELERLTAKDRQLIQNPEILENADPEMDMFLFLCSLK